MQEKYEDKFTEMYKEAEFLSSIEAEKIPEEEWRKRCQRLYDEAKQTKEDIDKEIKKLSETKRLFRRIDPVTRCDMISYHIKDDCKEKPEKCPVEVKKLIIKELEGDIYSKERELRWIKETPEEEQIKLYKSDTKESIIKRREDDIKKTKELIEKLRK